MAKQKTNQATASEAAKAEANASTSQILHGSDTLPALIDMGGDRVQVQLGTVVARAHQESGLSADAWNALPAIERDEKLIAVIEAMRADPRSGTDDALEQNSAPPDTGHTHSQAGDAGSNDAAAGGNGPAGAVLEQNDGKRDGAIDDDEPEGGWCYPILTPSTFRNVLVKEGFIQLTRDEAEPYLVAGVLGTDVCYPPNQEPAE